MKDQDTHSKLQLFIFQQYKVVDVQCEYRKHQGTVFDSY
jgi:hypothetical protein